MDLHGRARTAPWPPCGGAGFGRLGAASVCFRFPKRRGSTLRQIGCAKCSRPSTERYDRGDKRTIYAKAAVRHLWFVDPRPRMLEVFELTGGKWLLLDVFRDNAEVAAPPFAEQSFPLGLLWPFDPPVKAHGVRPCAETPTLPAPATAARSAARCMRRSRRRSCRCAACQCSLLHAAWGHDSFAIRRAGRRSRSSGRRWRNTSSARARARAYLRPLRHVCRASSWRTAARCGRRSMCAGSPSPSSPAASAEPVVYDGETPEARIARRKSKWTPTEIVWRGSDPCGNVRAHN